MLFIKKNILFDLSGPDQDPGKSSTWVWWRYNNVVVFVKFVLHLAHFVSTSVKT